MAAEWHYAKDGQEHGPVTSDELKEFATSGQLAPSDLVWKEGMDEWKHGETHHASITRAVDIGEKRFSSRTSS